MGQMDLFENYKYYVDYSVNYLLLLFLLRIVTWIYTCLLKIIISYLKPYDCVQKKNP